MFTYTDDQIAQIQALLTAGNFPAAYRLAANFAEGGEGVEQASILWMRGAADINQNVGSDAAFVRGYTAAQYQTRFGTALDPNLIQSVSDTIATNVLQKIITTKEVPPIAEIAVEDALPAATLIFRGDPGGWAGNPLFLFLGFDGVLKDNILEKPGDTYDALAMIKFLGATADWSSNLGAAFSATMGAGATGTVISGVGLTDNFLRAAYGGIAPSIQVAASQVVLGRVDAGDQLEGLAGGEFMNGGGGNDTLMSSAGNDVMDGGEDTDTADFSNASSQINVTVKAVKSTAHFTAAVTGSSTGIDSLFSIEKIIGSNQDDFFQVQSFPSGMSELTLDGGAGKDQLSAFFLPSVTIDTVNGTLSSGSKSITISNFERFEGTNSADTFILTGNEKEILGRGGTDTADFSKAAGPVTVGSGAVDLKDVEIVIGTSQGDTIDLSSYTNKVEVRGGAGQDTITTGSGDDVLDGGANADILMGGAGNDRYIVTDGDTVTDSDHSGSIAIGSRALTGGERKKDSHEPYKSASGDQYIWEGSGSLIIRTSDGATITVTDFQNHTLGINLSEKPDPDKPLPPGPFHNPPRSPLVLDLDGNGIDLSSVSTSGVHFDFNGDHFRELTAWVGPNDGFLVYDANHDGAISGTELFGNDTTNGFQILAFYDGRTGGTYYSDPLGGSIDPSKVNGVIDADDPIYSQLQVWRDLNQNGAPDAGELTGLADLGITQINLSYQETSTEIAGNEIRQTGSYVGPAGTSTIVDAWLSVNYKDTILDIDPGQVGAFEFWPNLHGYGQIAELHTALALEPDLAAQFRQFIDDAETLPVSGLLSRFETLMYAWAGVSDYADSRGEFMVGRERELAFLEKAYGTGYHQLYGWNEGTADPGPIAGATLHALFQNASATFLVKFLAQIPTLHLFEAQTTGELQPSHFDVLKDALTYNVETDFISFNATKLIADLKDIDFADPAAVQNAREIFGLMSLVQAFHETSDADFYGALKDAISDLGATKLLPLIDSFRIYDPANNGQSHSEEGDIYLLKSFNGDPATQYSILEANAVVTDRAAADLYYVRPDLGEITIQSKYLGDRIILSDEFNGAAYSVSRDVATGDVRIEFAALGTTLVLTSYLDPAVGNLGVTAYRDPLSGEINSSGVAGDSIFFADGTVLRPVDIAHAVTAAATEQNDLIYGTWIGDTIQGLGGDDTLIGGAGNDTITGGTGNDQLGDPNDSSQNAGDDTYVFGFGDGNDTIYDARDTWQFVSGFDSLGNPIIVGPAGNTLQLTDALPGDVFLVRTGPGGNDLVVTFSQQPGDSITLIGEFTGQTVSQIFFADGTVWDYETIQNRLILQNASDGDDTIVGFEGSDTLAGGRGNDTLQGSPSNFGAPDTFIYARGDGDDTIIANYTFSEDVLKLSGIRSDETTVTRNGDDAILTFNIPEGGSITLHGQYASLGWTVLERIEFADGVVWSQRDLVTAAEPTILAPTIIGTGGDDTIDGTTGRDGIDGGPGNDVLRGGAGSDTYFFAPGSGHDVIVESGADDFRDVDVLRIDATPADARLTRDGLDVIVELTASGDSVTLQNYFQVSNRTVHNAGASIERIAFSDGTVWDVPQITQNAWIRGGAGDDVINGTRDADVITGGPGHDTLVGGRGGDTYVIFANDGDDTVVEFDGEEGTDRILFADSTIGDVVFRSVYDAQANQENLIIARADGSASVQFDRFAGIDFVNFSDGTVLTMAQVLDRITFVGTDDAETIFASDRNDNVRGLKGDDQLYGSYGSDIYHWVRGDGNDTILDYGSDPADVDTLRLEGIDPTLVKLERVPTTNPFNGALYDLKVTIQPFQATDTFESITIAGEYGDGSSQTRDGIERIVFDDGTAWDRAYFAIHAPLIGTGASDFLVGTEFGETIIGKAGDDFLQGGAGSDTYIWSVGDGNDDISDTGVAGDVDTLQLHGVTQGDVALSRSVGDESSDAVVIHINSSGENIRLEHQASGGLRGIERIVFDSGVVWDVNQIRAATAFRGGNGNDFIDGTEFNDHIIGGRGNDYMVGHGGSDTYDYASGDGNDTIEDIGGSTSDLDVLNLLDLTPSDVTLSRDADDNLVIRINPTGQAIGVLQQFAPDTTAPSNGIEKIVFADGTTWNRQDISDHIAPVGVTLTGTNGANTLIGTPLNDTLIGLGGADILDGRGGADLMIGGTGSDTYYVDNPGDVVVENSGEGNDTVRASIASYTLPDNVENLIGSASFGQTLTGNTAANTITGGPGDDTIAGGAGNDTLDGGDGNDVLSGDDGNDTLTGGAGNDTLRGGAGNDTLDGGPGADTMFGGDGNDTYLVDDAGDLVVEALNEGASDTVRTILASYTLTANVENLTGLTAGQTLTGNDLNNTITAGTGASILYGAGGNDTLIGSVGGDTLYGGDGNDLLDGGPGSDTYYGGAGNDTYIVNDSGDVVVENVNEGTDTVKTTLASYALTANVEHLTGMAATGQTLIGNALANTITGGAGNDTLIGGDGNDTLNGGAGADTMIGGLGDDTFIVDDAGDVVIENADEGTDTVKTSLASYALTANVENLTGTATGGQTLIGNALANTITGSSGNDTLYGGEGNDTLKGGSGADTMYGGAGNDTYVVDDAGDVVIEYANEGTDTVKTSLASYTLTANVENLTGTASTEQTLIGNDLANTISGGSGQDIIFGAGGDDILKGGADNDIIHGGAGNDTISGNGGNDSLFGDEGNDTITGASGDDIIDGGTGDDKLTGNAGNDTFVFHAGFGKDIITDFQAGSGTDDVIEFHDGVFTSFSDVLAHAMTSGTSTIITVDAATTITLQHVALANLVQDDFRFL